VKNNSLLKVPNINSKDAKLKKLIYEVDESLFDEFFQFVIYNLLILQDLKKFPKVSNV